MMQAAEKKSIPGFFNEAVYPTGRGNLFVMGFRHMAADH